ncbi:MAG: phosphoglycolate phosphatase [Rhodocyclaceae bacterium]|nr:MAG: phosphoglycolate phosphatase [Rhodocyclaceae bacterium]
MTGATKLGVKAVMIDLDGTLLDTALDIGVAANAMLLELGRPECAVSQIRTYIGRGIPNLVKRCLAGCLDAADDPNPPPEAALASFRQHYAATNGRHATIYPGVEDGLRRLQEQGLRLACITNKATDFTLPLLAGSGLAHWFELVVCGDTLTRSKPDPLQLTHICQKFGIARHQALLIGDSLNDVRAARAAGCPVFCVPYGYNEGRDVRDLDCDAIVASIDDAASRVVAV